MPQLLIVEAVSAGLLSQPVDSLPPSLLDEGLAMLSSLCQDCLTVSDPCITEAGPAPSWPMQAFLPERFAASNLQVIAMVQPALVSAFTGFISRQQAATVAKRAAYLPRQAQLWTRRWQPANTVELITAEQLWSIDHHRTTGHSGAIPDCPKRLKIVDGPGGNPHQHLRQLADSVDAIWIIAPEPEASQLIATLQPWKQKLWNLPISVLQFAERKSNYTFYPYLVLDSMALPSLTLAGGLPDWLTESDALVLKPDNRCGCEGVYRLDKRSSLSSPREVISAVEQWIADCLPVELRNLESNWLLGPWVAGETLSVAFCMNEDRIMQFPVCRQELRWTPTVSTASIDAATAHYDGCCWAEPDRQASLVLWIKENLPRLIGNEFQAGWMGLDLIHHPQSNAATPSEEWTLVDFNARLTSSYNLLRHLRRPTAA